MTQVSLREAQSKLASLVRAAQHGEEIIISDDEGAIARLVSVDRALGGRHPRRAGSGKGVFKISPDFEAPLDDFKEYME